MWKYRMNPELEVKGILPIFGEEAIAVQHGADRIADCLVGPFTRTVLGGGACSCGLHPIIMLGDQRLHIGVLACLTSEVEAYNPSGRVTMGNPCQEDVEPNDRDRLPTHDHTKDKFGKEMVNYSVSVIIIQSDEALGPILVLGGLKHDATIQLETLSHRSSHKTGSVSAISLAPLIDQTIPTPFDSLWVFQLGHLLTSLV
jgi:hypothetical protein